MIIATMTSIIVQSLSSTIWLFHLIPCSSFVVFLYSHISQMNILGGFKVCAADEQKQAFQNIVE